MTRKIKMHARVEEGFEQILPETVASQVIDEASGKTIDVIMNEATNLKKIVETNFNMVATSEGQSIFEFEDPYFDPQNAVTRVHVNGEFMHPDEEYTIDTDGDYPKLVLVKSLPINTKVHITVARDTIVGKPNSGYARLNMIKYNVTATQEGQRAFDFGDRLFFKDNDSTLVFLHAEPLVEGEEYNVAETGSVIVLTSGVSVGTKLHIIVFRDVPMVSETQGLNASIITPGSIDLSRMNVEVVGKIDAAKTHADDMAMHNQFMKDGVKKQITLGYDEELGCLTASISDVL